VIVERCPLFGQKWLSKAKKIVKSKLWAQKGVINEVVRWDIPLTNFLRGGLLK